MRVDLWKNNSAITLLKRESSSRLFVVFTGNAHQLTMDPILFFRTTGLASHNLLIVRDLYRDGYRRGISTTLPSLKAFTDLLQSQLRSALSHVTTVFTLGSSSGGYPAIWCGDELGAEAMWCFGARICKQGTTESRDRALLNIFSKVLGYELPVPFRRWRPTAAERTRLQEFSQTDMGRRTLLDETENIDNIIDSTLLEDLCNRLHSSRTHSAVHIYFAPENAIDSHVAQVFSTLERVVMHPVRATRDIDWLGRPESHIIAKLLDMQGELASVFSNYV